MKRKTLSNLSARKGFRLRKLEVFNWGTFDSSRGEVYTVRPEGRTALLVGQNGSGKSTLVDALLTLLVKPGVRNFNVAAGAKKRERDEKTYIRGAYDRTNHDDGEGVRIKYLRPKGSHYSVILACFSNEETGACFAAALVLQIKGNEDVERIYCLSGGERSIQEDFGAPESTEAFRKTLTARNFRTTPHYTDFEGWFTRLTHVKPKAMDVFNETVSVKDIRQLNEFIRDHMLESSDWGKLIDGLLAHFNELSAAHQSLVQARRQHELLEPVARLGAEYEEATERLVRAERRVEAFDAWFSSILLVLFVPELERRQQAFQATELRLQDLQKELDETGERCRILANEIDRAGGERLRQIPLLVRQERIQTDAKRRAFHQYRDALKRVGVEDPIEDEASFVEMQGRIPSLHRQLEAAIEQRRQEQDPWREERGLTRSRGTGRVRANKGRSAVHCGQTAIS